MKYSKHSSLFLAFYLFCFAFWSSVFSGALKKQPVCILQEKPGINNTDRYHTTNLWEEHHEVNHNRLLARWSIMGSIIMGFVTRRRLMGFITRGRLMVSVTSRRLMGFVTRSRLTGFVAWRRLMISVTSRRLMVCHISRDTFFLSLTLCLFFTVSGCRDNGSESKVFTGIPGGHEGPPAAAGPPVDPASWHKIPGDVLHAEHIYGHRVNARTTFKMPGGMGLLYSSHPTEENREDPDWVRQQLERGWVTGPMGSLAFTRDLFSWVDYPGNPILNETQRSWQTTDRIHTRDMIFDPVDNRWAVYFGNMCEADMPGVRSVGVTYSKDLVNWEYADGPIFNIEGFASSIPHRIEATEEELYEHGRVYIRWAIPHEDRFYFVFSGTLAVGPTLVADEHTEAGGIRAISSGSIAMVSDTPEGPFEYLPGVGEDHILPGSKPVYWNGKWYSVFSGNWDGQPGFGLAWSDELFGPVTLNPHNPIIRVETTQRSNPILFNYEGTWGVLFSRGGEWSDPLPLRVALAHYHPSLFEVFKK